MTTENWIAIATIIAILTQKSFNKLIHRVFDRSNQTPRKMEAATVAKCVIVLSIVSCLWLLWRQFADPSAPLDRSSALTIAAATSGIFFQIHTLNIAGVIQAQKDLVGFVRQTTLGPGSGSPPTSPTT